MKKAPTQDIRDIQFTISTPGFKHLDDYLKREEIMLIRALRRKPLAEIPEVRGALSEVIKIKKFLGMKKEELERALEAGEEFEANIMAQNMR
jgi:hypothetical protein